MHAVRSQTRQQLRGELLVSNRNGAYLEVDRERPGRDRITTVRRNPGSNVVDTIDSGREPESCAHFWSLSHPPSDSISIRLENTTKKDLNCNQRAKQLDDKLLFHASLPSGSKPFVHEPAEPRPPPPITQHLPEPIRLGILPAGSNHNQHRVVLPLRHRANLPPFKPA